MTFSTTTTTARGHDPAHLVRETVAQLQGKAVRAGLVLVVGARGGELSKQLAAALPGVSFAGATCSGGEASLLGLWFTGEVHVAIASGAVTKALADAAVARGGFKPFQTRVGVLLAKAGRTTRASLFEVLPKGAAFFGADAADVFTHEGPVEGALLISDWPTQRAVGFEGLQATLARKGITRESVVGSLQVEASEVTALYGVPDRSPDAPAVVTLALSSAVDRSDA